MSEIPGYDRWKLMTPEEDREMRRGRDCNGCEYLDGELHAAQERIGDLEHEVETARAALRVCAALLGQSEFTEEQRAQTRIIIQEALR